MSSLVPQKRCLVCQAVKDSDALRRRIDRCSYYVPSSKDKLKHIARDHHDLFGYQSLINHVKKHQFPNAKEITTAEETAVTKKRSAGYKEIWELVLEKGKEGLETGKMDVNLNQVLLAARDKSNFEKQSKDQSLALMEMVFKFSAGEIGLLQNGTKHREILESEAGPSGATDQPTTGPSEEPIGPRDFYKSLAGDAPSRRPSEILEGNHSSPNQEEHPSTS